MPVQIGTGEAQVTLLEGAARIRSASDTWKPLKSGGVLKGGDQVSVEKHSRLEIRLPDQSVLRFSENTMFKIVSLDIGETTRIARIHIALGKTWANVAKSVGGARSNYEMSSRNAVCGVRGTVYRMNVDKDASVLVRVYEGEVNVSGIPSKGEKRHPSGTLRNGRRAKKRSRAPARLQWRIGSIS